MREGLDLVDFVPSSLRQVDAIVTSCPMSLLLGEFTACIGSRLLDTKATRLTCTGALQVLFFDG